MHEADRKVRSSDLRKKEAVNNHGFFHTDMRVCPKGWARFLFLFGFICGENPFCSQQCDCQNVFICRRNPLLVMKKILGYESEHAYHVSQSSCQ